MPAFQLNMHAAALVSDTVPPQIAIVQVTGVGVTIVGRDALEQLKAACQLALDGDTHRRIAKPGATLRSADARTGGAG